MKYIKIEMKKKNIFSFIPEIEIEHSNGIIILNDENFYRQEVF